jgi:hypothetical protein
MVLVERYLQISKADAVSIGVFNMSSRYFSKATRLASTFAGACPLKSDFSGVLAVNKEDCFRI